MDRRVVLTGVLAVHLAVAAFHGTTHSLVPVHLPAWQNAIVVASTFVGPVVGVALAWRDNPLGVPLFTASMACALLTGGILHFVLDNPDHVHAIPASPWRPHFHASAVAIAVVQGIGTAIGVRYWRTE